MIGNGVPKLVERGFNAVGMRPEPAQLDELVAMFAKEYKICATERTRPYPHIVETLDWQNISAAWLAAIPPAPVNQTRNLYWPVFVGWSRSQDRA